MHRSRTLQLEKGYTLIALMVLLAVCMLVISTTGPMWSAQMAREREKDLQRIGFLYAQAIASYYKSSPGTLKQFPSQLEDLLVDKRYVTVRRYLRALYPDPVNPDQPWGLIYDQNRQIIGVYSLSQTEPRASVGTAKLSETVLLMNKSNENLDSSKHYSDWKFMAKINHEI